ncbi:hypothetical protein Pcinc_042670 [Petrolisthes cinctipes]|uniref:gamma-glutamylcyclotransferase n=1 Tax=Petrolisthes cinctipes TaxID=88211 RepID=A0AAE1BIA6_PETCI|nr:hypothetical protein Pcinc_042670 [Petrolisthes cinctipes]
MITRTKQFNPSTTYCELILPPPPPPSTHTQDYRLDFNYFSQRWKGAAATIVEAPGHHVYGIVWEINDDDLDNLDRQEGVSQGIYRVLKVEVETDSRETLTARSYQIANPQHDDRRPSAVYLDVIINGARENGLPEDYIKFLESIEHNKYSGKVELNLDLATQPT